MAHGGGEIDDAAIALRLHHAQLVFQAQKRTKHIGVEGRGVLFHRLPDDRPATGFRAGVIDSSIERAKARDCLVDQPADIVLEPDIRRDKFGFGAKAPQLGLE
jgi:hypothetical protein